MFETAEVIPMITTQNLHAKIAKPETEVESRIADLGIEIDKLHSSIQDLGLNSLKLFSEIGGGNFQMQAEIVKVNLDLSEGFRKTARKFQSLRDTLSKF